MLKNFMFCFVVFFLMINVVQGQQLDHTPGHLLIQLNAQHSTDALIHDFAAIDLQPERFLSKRLNIWLFQFNIDQISDEDALSDVRRHHTVKVAQFDHYIQLRSTYPNDPRFNEQWALENTGQNGGTPDADIDAPEAWDLSTGGMSAVGDTIIVAIVDNGFDLNHQDLNFWKNWREIPGNGVDDDNNGYIDDYDGWNAYNHNGNITSSSHGTHVSGIAAAMGDNATGVSGVNWGAKVMPIQGSSSQESVVIEAYGYVLEMRARYNETNGEYGAFVVSTNASFGVDFGDPDDYPLWCGMYDSLGVQGIVSAGATANRNINIDEQGDVPTACPSDYLISVTNTTRNDTRASAGYGATTIDLGAPGSDVLSTVPGSSYSTMTGTSMASPHVAGAVALMVSAASPALMNVYHNEPAEAALLFRDWLLQGTDPIPALEGITVTGGRLNIFHALELVQSYTSATIRGTITDDETGDPIPADVWSTGEDVFETTANENGEYVLEVVPGTYTIHSSYFGYYESESQAYTVEDEDDITVDLTLTARPTGVLEGYIIDARTGLPIENAVLELLDVPISSTTSDANGFYTFGGIPGDYTYTLFCDAPNYASQTIDVALVAGETYQQDFALAFAQSFELDDANWAGERDWEWGIPTPEGGPEIAYEGEYCWGTNLEGEYDPLTNASLITTSYTLNAPEPPYHISFYHWYETVDGWDGGNVHITTDNGENWTLIHPEGDYPDQSVVALAGRAGYTGDSEGWIHAQFDLSEYAGETVQFKFLFRSTNSRDYGWFIDFFAVAGEQCEQGDLIVSGQVNYRDQDLPIPNTDLMLNGNTTYTTSSDAAGMYQFTVTEQGNYTLTPAKTGDVNGISTFDAAYVAQYSASIIDLSEHAVLAADVSGNGSVNTYDAALIAQYASQMDVDCLCGEWGFVPTERVYAPLNRSMLNQDFIGILYGEVTDNWTPPAMLRFANESTSVPVQVNLNAEKAIFQNSTNGILAFQFVIKSEKEVIAQLAENVPSDWQLIVNQHDQDHWFVGGYGTTELPVGSAFVEIEHVEHLQQISGFLNEAPIQLEAAQTAVPKNFSLFQNYPNPFNPTTHIRFDLPQPASVSLNVYDVEGRLVKSLVNDNFVAGMHTIKWNGTNDDGQKVGSGVYFYQLTTDGFEQVNSMLLLK